VHVGELCTLKIPVCYSLTNSTVTFINNTAVFGGGVYSRDFSSISFDGDTLVTFKHNSASENGGAIITYKNGTITIAGKSNLTFSDYKANYSGSIFSTQHSKVLFSENAVEQFNCNEARKHGGAVYSSSYSEILFNGNQFSGV